MSNTSRNEPLGLQNAPARTSVSSLPSPFPPHSRSSSQGPPKSRRKSAPTVDEKKTTKDGRLILDPQPDDSMNDPLNWPAWRRDVALLSLGFYCCLGGGMTPVLAAGFSKVAASYHVSIPQVALTTGLYMMGLGLGSVVASPTAILYGKRPVYIAGITMFIVSSIWCALSPNYASLVVARVFMGFAVSPVECLPSATIAEIFYLHERAYRLGIYTLLLLSGKNLIPLVSAAIIQGLDWQWVFWSVFETSIDKRPNLNYPQDCGYGRWILSFPYGLFRTRNLLGSYSSATFEASETSPCKFVQDFLQPNAHGVARRIYR